MLRPSRLTIACCLHFVVQCHGIRPFETGSYKRVWTHVDSSLVKEKQFLGQQTSTQSFCTTAAWVGFPFKTPGSFWPTTSPKNHHISHQESVDVFAFGTMMWEVMANDIPFVTWRIIIGPWQNVMRFGMFVQSAQRPMFDNSQANLDPADIRERVVEGVFFFFNPAVFLGTFW